MASMPEADGKDTGVQLADLSINQIFFRFWRERLAVHPLAWTSRHLRLMRCAFVEMPTPKEPSEIPCAQEPTAEAARLWGRISGDIDSAWRAETMEEILRCYSFTKPSETLFFRFGRYDVELPCETFIATASDPNNLQSCSISYVDYVDVTRFRQRNLSYIEERRFQEEPHVDPYIIAVLIAQAQRCQRRDSMLRPREHALQAEAFSKVHVLLFSYLKGQDHQILVYTACVTNAFLDKLAYPSRTPGPVDLTSLQAWHTAVQLQPHESFHKRLMAAVYASPRGAKRRLVDE